MGKHNYHIRINPYAVALVDEGCPQETIDALCKMSELALKKYEDKSNVKTSVTSGEEGPVTLSTSPSFKESNLRHKMDKSAEVLNQERDIKLILLGMKFFGDLDCDAETNITVATHYYKSLIARGENFKLNTSTEPNYETPNVNEPK